MSAQATASSTRALARVALFTKFPEGPQLQIIRFRLRESYSIEVAEQVNIDRMSKTAPKLHDVDAGLFMHEMSNPAQHKAVARACERAGKPLFLLHRKYSSWAVDFVPFFKHLENRPTLLAAAQDSVKDSGVSPVARKPRFGPEPKPLFQAAYAAEAFARVVRMREELSTWMEVSDAVRRFQVDPDRVYTPPALIQRLDYQVDRGFAPDSFVAWWRDGRVEEEPKSETTLVSGSVPAEIRSAPLLKESNASSTFEEEKALFEEENARLTFEVRALRAQLATAKEDGAREVVTMLVEKLLAYART